MNSNDDEAIMTEMSTNDEMENTSMNDSSSSAKSFLSNGSPEKTPVSLLKELCEKKGITPQYGLVENEGPIHDPPFQYLVTVEGIVATGSGQSKKKAAKQTAAKAMLDILNARQQQSPCSNTTIGK